MSEAGGSVPKDANGRPILNEQVEALIRIGREDRKAELATRTKDREAKGLGTVGTVLTEGDILKVTPSSKRSR